MTSPSLADASLVIVPGKISLLDQAKLLSQLTAIAEDRWWHVGDTAQGVAIAFTDLREGWPITASLPMSVMVRKGPDSWSIRERPDSIREFVIETPDHDVLLAVIASMMSQDEQ